MMRRTYSSSSADLEIMSTHTGCSSTTNGTAVRSLMDALELEESSSDDGNDHDDVLEKYYSNSNSNSNSISSTRNGHEHYNDETRRTSHNDFYHHRYNDKKYAHAPLHEQHHNTQSLPSAEAITADNHTTRHNHNYSHRYRYASNNGTGTQHLHNKGGEASSSHYTNLPHQEQSNHQHQHQQQQQNQRMNHRNSRDTAPLKSFHPSEYSASLKENNLPDQQHQNRSSKSTNHALVNHHLELKRQSTFDSLSTLQSETNRENPSSVIQVPTSIPNPSQLHQNQQQLQQQQLQQQQLQQQQLQQQQLKQQQLKQQQLQQSGQPRRREQNQHHHYLMKSNNTNIATATENANPLVLQSTTQSSSQKEFDNRDMYHNNKNNNSNNNNNNNNNTLVLNPSSSSSGTGTAATISSSLSKNNHEMMYATNPKNTTFKNLLLNVQLPRPTRLLSFTSSHSQQQQQQQLLYQQQQQQQQSEQEQQQQQQQQITAVTFAKHASHAGYLSKLGGSISEYKRRFFVLKPTTCLYYFLSPNDVEPRGCIDLDGGIIGEDGWDDYENVNHDGRDDNGNGNGNGNVRQNRNKLNVNSLGSLPDGRFRFEIVLPIHNNDNETTSKNHDSTDYGDEDEMNTNRHNIQPKRIVLEARNEQVGKEWMELITSERLSYTKAEISNLLSKINTVNEEKIQLEQQIDELRLVEKDRDAAIQDANEWKDKMQKLDDSLKILRRWMSRPPPDSNCDTKEEVADVKEHCDKSGDSTTSKINTCQEKDKDAQKQNHSFSTSIEEDNLELEQIHMPETNFESLTNVCRGVRENLRLTSVEANTAVEDLNNANEKVKALEERMAKAEKYICKLWEENCSMRERLKKKKNETKILVKEVKSLMDVAKRSSVEIETLKTTNEELLLNAAKHNNAQKSSKTMKNRKIRNGRRQLATPEKKLLRELEEHVDMSLLQHQNLLEIADDNLLHSEVEETKEFCDEELLPCVLEESSETLKDISHESTPNASNAAYKKTINDHLPHKLFEPRDGNSSESDDSIILKKEGKIQRTFSPLRPKSLLDQITQDEEEAKRCSSDNNSLESLTLTETDDLNATSRTTESYLNTYDLSHPLSKLDEDSLTVPSELSLKSLVTDNCQATSKLVCPLTDVKPAKNGQDQTSVYHLTFYSAKIGLQFQKVPNQVQRTAALTDAMTADLFYHEGEGASTASSRTDAELRLIASLSNQSKAGKEAVKDSACPVILPKHIVLICGFHGFDNTSSNQRPSLGARLIAFDGISIERGPWTFETVSKAIKARPRPLTLSFRDDYLTMEQRAILTKAVADVEGSNQIPRTRRFNQHNYTPGIPRVINAARKELYNSALSNVTSGDSINSGSSNNIDVRSAKDILFHDDSDIDISVSTDNNSRSSDNWRSFSDAGSSSVFSTKFAPLMAGLIAGMSEKNHKAETFTPEYFRRPPDLLDSIPDHKEFKAALL